jgi:hypothetical protein
MPPHQLHPLTMRIRGVKTVQYQAKFPTTYSTIPATSPGHSETFCSGMGEDPILHRF